MHYIVSPFDSCGNPILNGKGESLARQVWAKDEEEAKTFFMNRFTTAYWVEKVANFRLDVRAA